MIALYYCYLFVLMSAFGCGMIHLRKLDKAGKIFCVFCGFIFLAESTAYYAARVYHTNMAVYAVSNILGMLLLCLYFNYSVDYFRKSALGVWLGIISVLLGILNTGLFQPVTKLCTNFLVYEGIVTVAVCMFAFFRLLADSEKLRLKNIPQFWVMTTLVLYWTITLLSWSVYEFLGEKVSEYNSVINLLILVANIGCYATFGIIFLLYPKMLRANNG